MFVVFTMRSDHLGDCDEFLGLPEALNESQYLVPRLNRDEVRLAIEGPIRLFQKEVAPRLVDRLLNDLGGQHDQLPVLQHALMRMWVRLVESGQPTMDLEHYRDVGMLADALRRHADEALAGLDPAVVHAKEAVKAALDALDPQELRFFQVDLPGAHGHRPRQPQGAALAEPARAARAHRADAARAAPPARALRGRSALLPPLLGRGRIDGPRRDARRHLAREPDPAVGPAAGLGPGGSAEPQHLRADPRRRPPLGGGRRQPLGRSGPHAGAAVVGQVQAEPALGAALRGRVRRGRQVPAREREAPRPGARAREGGDPEGEGAQRAPLPQHADAPHAAARRRGRDRRGDAGGDRDRAVAARGGRVAGGPSRASTRPGRSR